MRKKGSLYLSIDVIILVIIAIVVMALAIFFIKNIFLNMTLKVKEAVDSHELSNPPSEYSPVTLTPPSYTIMHGETAKITLSFLNIIPKVMYCKLAHTSQSPAVKIPEILYSDRCMEMKKDQINTWTVVVTATENTAPETTIFTMQMMCYPDNLCTYPPESSFTRDLTIKITE